MIFPKSLGKKENLGNLVLSCSFIDKSFGSSKCERFLYLCTFVALYGLLLGKHVNEWRTIGTDEELEENHVFYLCND
jgi:hypothetical protein